MSAPKEEGKDRVIFVTKEDHETPSNAELVEEDPDDPYEERGLILPSGEINWDCPCLGGMASGPCGPSFKEAFSCFHYSKEEMKGSDCLEQFRGMQECMQRYPKLYPQEDDKETDDEETEDRAVEKPPPSQDSAPEQAPAPEPDSTSAPPPAPEPDSAPAPAPEPDSAPASPPAPEPDSAPTSSSHPVHSTPSPPSQTS